MPRLDTAAALKPAAQLTRSPWAQWVSTGSELHFKKMPGTGVLSILESTSRLYDL